MVVTISAEEESRRKRLRDREYQKKASRQRRCHPPPVRREQGLILPQRGSQPPDSSKNCGLSMEQIAERMDVSRRTVQRWLP